MYMEPLTLSKAVSCYFGSLCRSSRISVTFKRRLGPASLYAKVVGSRFLSTPSFVPCTCRLSFVQASIVSAASALGLILAGSSYRGVSPRGLVFSRCHRSRGELHSYTMISRPTGQGNPIETPSWKPATLRPPFLLSFVALALAFIAILEALCQKSRINDGVAFTATTFSPSINFMFMNLPTVIATLYSILWSWVDLDTKRLEPWFQLSRPEGARPEESLLLQYPFDVLAFAPLKALRRR